MNTLTLNTYPNAIAHRFNLKPETTAAMVTSACVFSVLQAQDIKFNFHLVFRPVHLAKPVSKQVSVLSTMNWRLGMLVSGLAFVLGFLFAL